MRAVAIEAFGGPEVLTPLDLPVPDPGPGQVGIDVTHAAVGLVDVLMRRGDVGGSPPLVPGLEVAGVVRALGAGVDGLAVGDQVVTLSRPTAGGYAEVSVADAGVVIPLGSEIDPSRAVAALPNLTTALLALSEVARVRTGDRVLVLGASGALGAAAVDAARALDLDVTAAVRTTEQAQEALTGGAGATVLVDDLVGAGADGVRFDVVIDPLGGAARAAALAMLAPLGRLVVVGDAAGEDTTVRADDLWIAGTAVLGLNGGHLAAVRPDLVRPVADRALAMLADPEVGPHVYVLPLERARDAHERLEAGGVGGRLVLRL